MKGNLISVTRLVPNLGELLLEVRVGIALFNKLQGKQVILGTFLICGQRDVAHSILLPEIQNVNCN